MKRLACFCLVAVAGFPALAVAADPIRVTGGEISGTIDDGVRAYKGIPFAAPPVGELRWQPPQAVIPWAGVKECSEFSEICPQPGYPDGSFYKRPAVPMNEDCLYLNVWTDAEKVKEKRPVMVWFHGGALTRGTGSIPTYNGANLAKKGVVLVTVNYRLGPLGYLAHPELTEESAQGSSGNYGVLDQVAALRWVNRNIELFGGDPDNVTIFGESAGSWSVHALLATPLSKGLVHRAIGESGATFGWDFYLADKSKTGSVSGEEVGLAFMKALGVETLAEMRALPSEKIVEVFEKNPEGRKFRTRPVVDGWVFPEETENIFYSGRQHDVPVMVGFNAKEMSTLSNPATLPKEMGDYRARITTQYGANADGFHAVYPASTIEEASDAYLRSQGDTFFGLQMRGWARATERLDSNAYLYYFTRVPPLPQSEYTGAYHAAEIAYAFNNNGKSNDYTTEIDLRLADQISDYWVNFATNGDPNGKGLPKWLPYSTHNGDYMELGDTPKAGQHVLKEQLDFLEKALVR
ncbi:MAG: carboxylesterase family protein [Candidatus Hydrogenedentota bacterium]